MFKIEPSATNSYNEWRKEVYVIADELVKEFAGKLLSKSGIRNKYDIPYNRGIDTFKILTMECGFTEVRKTSLRVPLVRPDHRQKL